MHSFLPTYNTSWLIKNPASIWTVYKPIKKCTCLWKTNKEYNTVSRNVWRNRRGIRLIKVVLWHCSTSPHLFCVHCDVVCMPPRGTAYDTVLQCCFCHCDNTEESCGYCWQLFTVMTVILKKSTHIFTSFPGVYSKGKVN